MTTQNGAVEVRGITKLFGGVAALDRVDLTLLPGEVHALLGENGAGKTTLSNILAGIYRADEGQVLVEGVEHHFRSPSQAIAAGIGMVHQHFRLVAPMTVAENIHLGWAETPRVVTSATLEERTRALMDEIGLHIDPSARIWQLSVGEQQRVEILRVLARGAKVLILDEPTAVLTHHEARELFGVMRQLVAGGRTVVFISHKLNEVLEVCDTISVLRGGQHVITRPAEGATARELARLMTGAEHELAVEHREVTGETVLELVGVKARNSRGLPALHGVDLSVHRGEVMGIAGVSGNGQTELAEVVTSLRRVESGSVQVAGRDVTNVVVARRGRGGCGSHPRGPDRRRHGEVRVRPLQRGDAALSHGRVVQGLPTQFVGRQRLRPSPRRCRPGPDPFHRGARRSDVGRQPAAAGGPPGSDGGREPPGCGSPHPRSRRSGRPGGAADVARSPRQRLRRPAHLRRPRRGAAAVATGSP